MKYIESKPNGDGTYDHTEVRAAYDAACAMYIKHPAGWVGYDEWETPTWGSGFQYCAQVPDTYGIHESSSTLREVKGDAGPAVAEMLLDRIKELENILSSIEHSVNQALIPGNDWRRELRLIESTIELNKEQK